MSDVCVLNVLSLSAWTFESISKLLIIEPLEQRNRVVCMLLLYQVLGNFLQLGQ